MASLGKREVTSKTPLYSARVAAGGLAITTLDAGTPRRALSPSTRRRALFAVMAVLTLWALYVYDLPFLTDPAKGLDRLMGFKWWLLPHALAGTAAFLIGPLQFSATLRNANWKRHRLLGQAYVAAVTLSALLAIVITLYFQEFGQVQLMVQSLAWLLCTWCAFLAARNRNQAVHRLWAARSYSLTFFFITIRLALGAFFPDATPERTTEIAWVLMVVALVIPDLLMSGGALRPWRKA